MNIYPKTCRNFEGINNLMPFIKKYGGVELQFFKEGDILSPFEIHLLHIMILNIYLQKILQYFKIN